MALTRAVCRMCTAAVPQATGNFSDVQTIGAKDVLRLQEEGEKTRAILERRYFRISPL